MILLSNTLQVIVSSPRHGQHQPAGQSQDAAEVGGCAALLVHARPRRQEAVQVRVGAQVFQSVTSCLEPNTADRRASQRMRMRQTLMSETAGQTLVKKQRSAATPKLKVAGSTKLAAASKSMIYVTILMNFLIHELNKFTPIESPSQYFFIL